VERDTPWVGMKKVVRVRGIGVGGVTRKWTSVCMPDAWKMEHPCPSENLVRTGQNRTKRLNVKTFATDTNDDTMAR
jgi:hypothetical protein